MELNLQTRLIQIENRVKTWRAAAISGANGLSQEENFRCAGYDPLPWQWQFHRAAREADKPDGPRFLLSGGSMGPGKTLSMLAQALADDAIRQPGLMILFIQKEQIALRETFHQKLMEAAPPERVGYEFVESKSEIRFNNGSWAKILHFRSEGDIARHIGQQWDLICVENSMDLSEAKLKFIPLRLRTIKENWRPRMYMTTNPGGVAHAYLKRLFVDKIYRGNERPSDYAFFHATIDDNPHLSEQDPDYVRFLNGLEGWQRKAYRDGQWDILAGTFFTNWVREKIVIPPPYKQVPPGWRVFAGMDYGWTHPTCWGIHAIDEQGNGHTIRTHSRNKWSPAEHLDLLCQYPEFHRLRYVVAGLDAFNREQGKPSVVEEYVDEARKRNVTLSFTEANTDRIQGAALMVRRFGNDKNSPTWFIWDNGYNEPLIECIPLMVHDPHRPEDVLKVDANPETGMGGDDCYDMLRYSQMSTPVPIADVRKTSSGVAFSSFGVDNSRRF